MIQNEIEVIITGSGDPPPLSQLGANLEARLEELVKVKLLIVPSEEQLYEGTSE